MKSTPQLPSEDHPVASNELQSYRGEQSSMPSTEPSPNVLTLAAITGIVGIVIASILNLNSGAGFIIGFVVGFLIFWIRLVVLERRIDRTKAVTTQVPQAMGKEPPAQKGMNGDVLRLLLSFAIVVVGIVAVIILVVWFGTSPPSTVGTGISAISTLVGFLAGHTAGAAGKENAENRANDAQDKLNKAIKAAPDAVSGYL